MFSSNDNSNAQWNTYSVIKFLDAGHGFLFSADFVGVLVLALSFPESVSKLERFTIESVGIVPSELHCINEVCPPIFELELL